MTPKGHAARQGTSAGHYYSFSLTGRSLSIPPSCSVIFGRGKALWSRMKPRAQALMSNFYISSWCRPAILLSLGDRNRWTMVRLAVINMQHSIHMWERRNTCFTLCLLNATTWFGKGECPPPISFKAGVTSAKGPFWASSESQQYSNAMVICPHCCLMNRQWSSLDQLINFSLLHRSSQGWWIQRQGSGFAELEAQSFGYFPEI